MFLILGLSGVTNWIIHYKNAVLIVSVALQLDQQDFLGVLSCLECSCNARHMVTDES